MTATATRDRLPINYEAVPIFEQLMAERTSRRCRRCGQYTRGGPCKEHGGVRA